MLRFYGTTPPAWFNELQIGGKCPHCGTGSRFTLHNTPSFDKINRDGVTEFVAGYSCDACLEAIPVIWDIVGRATNGVQVDYPRVVLPVRDDYDFSHVPEEVKKEVDEALACLSVGAYNGFAALCRRAVQAMCEQIGAKGSSKVQNQITEMIELTGLDDEWKELSSQIMLTGHDGAHPHLPEVNADRAVVLLSLLQDLTYQLYTRPGKVQEAALLRRQAIEQNR
ncbi:DUF4145 domain-containing protein [Rubrivirga sp.]|uniref:DUF4145 domain-containing protein n=1 Tax=Rubrivirga sp. TaxID=1885344 RepID=UPI003B52E685